MDKVCTPVGGTSAFYHVVPVLITVYTIPVAVSSAVNSFSCKDHLYDMANGPSQHCTIQLSGASFERKLNKSLQIAISAWENMT